MNDEQKAARVKQFLEDEVIVEIFRDAEQECFDHFRTSADLNEAKGAWEIARAIQVLKHKFEVVLDAGKRAEIVRVKQEKADELAEQKRQQRFQRVR